MSDLPTGFVLDAPAAGQDTNPHGLPAGFVLDTAPAQPKPARTATDLPDITDPSSSDYSRRHGGSFVTGLVDAFTDAASKPGDAATGRFEVMDPSGHVTDQAIGAGAEMAMMFNPVPPARVTTQGLRGSASVTEAPAGNTVVDAASRIEVPIPRGVATESTARQALTQAARSMPFGGSRIDDAITASRTALEDAAERTARNAARLSDDGALPAADAVGASVRTELETGAAQRQALADRDVGALRSAGPQGQAPSSAALGENIREGYTRRIDDLRRGQDENYAAVRRTINPDQPVVVSDEMIAPLQQVMRERVAGAQGELPRELMPALDIATNPRGVTFDGLQRARSTLGRHIDFEEANGGFNTGDLKRAYGALTDAMHSAVQQSARSDPGIAMAAFRHAEDNFGASAERIRDLGQVAAGSSEGLVNRLIGYGSERTAGNVQRMRSLLQDVGVEDRAGLSRLAFQRLGGEGDAFDLGRFASQWQRMTPEGRAELFGGQQATRIEQVLRQAQGTSAATREANADVLRLLGSSDEQLANRLVSMATTGASADHSTLARMASIIGRDGMGGVSSLAIQRLGVGRTGEFSAPAFSTNWQRMSDAGKSLLFPEKVVRSALDDIATVSARMAEVDRRFANKSGTARAGTLTGLMAGMTLEPLTVLSSLVGGQVLSRILSKPATASSAAKWVRAAEGAATSPSLGANAQFERLTRNLLATLKDARIQVTPGRLLGEAQEVSAR